MKFDFKHIDPRTGLPRITDQKEDCINLMLRTSVQSGYIRMLQNRVNLRSVGNLRYSARLWYDARTKTLHNVPGAPLVAYWHTYRLTLRGGQKPAGWLEG